MMSKISDFLESGIRSTPISSVDYTMRELGFSDIKSLDDAEKKQGRQTPFLLQTPEVWMYEVRVSCQLLVYEWIIVSQRAAAIYESAGATNQLESLWSDLSMLWKKWKIFSALETVRFVDCVEGPICVEFCGMIVKMVLPKDYDGDDKGAMAEIRKELRAIKAEFNSVRAAVMEASMSIDERDGNLDGVNLADILTMDFIKGISVEPLPEELVKKLEEERRKSFNCGLSPVREMSEQVTPSEEKGNHLKDDEDENDDSKARKDIPSAATEKQTTTPTEDEESEEEEDDEDDFLSDDYHRTNTSRTKLPPPTRSRTHPPGEEELELPKWYQKHTSIEEKHRDWEVQKALGGGADTEVWKKVLESTKEMEVRNKALGSGNIGL